MRRCARDIIKQPTTIQAHETRLRAALASPGVEPVQGVIADIFVTFGKDHAPLKRRLLALCRDRLPGHVLRWFEAQISAAALEPVTALATRWSVLARPSANISTRARRCGPDDSRLLANQAIAAMEANDHSALQAFLHHCITCHDNLAFMLARRAMLQRVRVLPSEWDLTSQQLEQAMETT